MNSTYRILFLTRNYEIYERKKGVQLIGCWAHARRKFVNALNEDKDLAGKALEYIGLFYSTEYKIINRCYYCRANHLDIN